MGKIKDVTITLVIPVYNVEPYLEQCLESVVNQSVSFDEIILINDGSTDNSLKICKQYVSSYNYFEFINQENKGLSSARNVGMEHASSKYIMFLDSDDYLRNDTAEILKSRLQNAEYDAIFFDSDILCETDFNLIKRNIYDRSETNIDGMSMSGWKYFSICYPRNYVVSACMAVYKKDLIRNAMIQFPEGRYYEDNYFTFAFLNQVKNVIHISDKLYQRRYREHSITISKYTEKKFIDYIEVSRLVWKNICKSKYENIPELRKLLFAYISDQCIRSLKDYQTCKAQGIELSVEASDLLVQTMEDYFDLLKKSDWDDVSLDLSIVVRTLIIFHYINSLHLMQGIDLRFPILEIVKIQKELYIRKLKELPFNREGFKVGIYGTGKHTEGLFLLYEKLIGKIMCNIIFIDSKRDNDTYGNKKLVHIQRIGEMDLDLIVVSSFIYEQEMIRNVRRVQPEASVYTFYEELNEDIFSNYEIFLEY